jgi:hypothetical protein
LPSLHYGPQELGSKPKSQEWCVKVDEAMVGAEERAERELEVEVAYGSLELEPGTTEGAD